MSDDSGKTARQDAPGGANENRSMPEYGAKQAPDKEIRLLIEANPHFSLWNEVRLFFLSTMEDKLAGEEAFNRELNMHLVFSDILKLFVKHSRFRGLSVPDQFRPNLLWSQHAWLESTFFDPQIQMGLSEHGIYLNAYLYCPMDILRRMPDSFWLLLMEFFALENSAFQSNAGFMGPNGKSAEKYLDSSKSYLFKIIGRVALAETYDFGAADFGWLEIRWPVATGWKDVLVNGFHAFGKLYRIQYLIHRRYSAYMRSHVRSKKLQND